MPNWVSHEIRMPIEGVVRLRNECFTDGEFDFRRLVPEPPHIYLGGLSGQDEDDFPCNWLSWNRANWGTKWNACRSVLREEADEAVLRFETAWSVPYPIMAALYGRYGLPMEHRYYDEGENFWGVEMWGNGEGSFSDWRTSVRKSLPEDLPTLRALFGYDHREPDEPDEPLEATP